MNFRGSVESSAARVRKKFFARKTFVVFVVGFDEFRVAIY